MTNREFFKEQLLDIACIAHKGHIIGVNEKTGCPMTCSYPDCSGCLFTSKTKSDCHTKLLNWCKAKYENIWKNVDAKILVNGNKRHFAKYENGLVYYYANGRSSFTNDSPLSCCLPSSVTIV